MEHARRNRAREIARFRTHRVEIDREIQEWTTISYFNLNVFPFIRSHTSHPAWLLSFCPLAFFLFYAYLRYPQLEVSPYLSIIKVIETTLVLSAGGIAISERSTYSYDFDRYATVPIGIMLVVFGMSSVALLVLCIADTRFEGRLEFAMAFLLSAMMWRIAMSTAAFGAMVISAGAEALVRMFHGGFPGRYVEARRVVDVEHMLQVGRFGEGEVATAANRCLICMEELEPLDSIAMTAGCQNPAHVSHLPCMIRRFPVECCICSR